MQNFIIIFTIVLATVVLFLAMRQLYKRYPFPFFHPVLTATIIICAALVIFNISYDQYMKGGKWVEELLGACVIALAYPLYNQRKIMLQYKNAILLGFSSGLITAMGSIVFFSKLFKVEDEIIFSIIPKSITTPVAIQMSDAMGGIPSLTAVFVMIAGFSGVIIGPYVMQFTGIKNPLGKGLALGCASHALGAAKATEYGELALSMASVSMTISAIIGSLIGPLLVILL